MNITTDAELAALPPRTLVESNTGKRFTLEYLEPATATTRALWWVTPVVDGRRARIGVTHFVAGWSVVRVAEADAVRLVDYGMSAESTSRHYVEAGAPVGDDGRYPTVCARFVAHVITSDKVAPWGMVARLTTCRICDTKAAKLGMITRQRAAELEAERAAAVGAPAAPAEPAVEAPAERLPYTADHVLYLVEARYMAALWTSDPKLAELGAAALYERLLDHSLEIELIATVTLNRKSEGSLYSGWMADASKNTVEPIARKADALAYIRQTVADYFNRSTADVEPAPDDAPLAPVADLAVGTVVEHHGLRAEYTLTAPMTGGKWWARPTLPGGDITIEATQVAGGLIAVKATGARPTPAVGDAVTIDGVPGVWVVTHTPDAPAKLGPCDYAPDTRSPLRTIESALGYYRAQRVFVGDGESAPMAFGLASARWPHRPAAEAPVGTMGVWFHAGNGPVVVPIAEAHIDHAPRCAERVRNWQRKASRNVDATVVVRLEAGWVDGRARLRAPADHGAEAEVEVDGAAPAAAGPSASRRAAPAPALPQADDSAPLRRHDLVTYHGSRYVVIRPDSVAEAARRDGHVELYRGDVLPHKVPNADRGHWVAAGACARRLLLHWGMRRFDPAAGETVVIPMAGRAFAEHAVALAPLLGDASAELVARVPGGQWAPAPMRSETEREAAVAAVLTAID